MDDSTRLDQTAFLSHDHDSTAADAGLQDDLPWIRSTSKVSSTTFMRQHRRQGWMSVWLQKWTLISLAVLFATLCASVVVLWRANSSQDGFRTTLSSNHYTWTYGPTAVLVIILSFWRQVDYHCKMMQPWQALQQSGDAAHTVLLDYIAPLSITSFVTAIQLKHYAVVASITGFTALKLLIVASTGLLVLVPTIVNKASPVILTTSFDGKSFWSSIPGGEHRLFSGDREISVYDNVSTLPVHTYLGILDGGIEAPAGTKDNRAFQSFELVDAEAGVNRVSAEVDVFSPNITCEIADVTWNTTRGFSTMQLQSKSCLVGSPNQTRLEALGFSCPASDCPEQEYTYYFQRINCSETTEPKSETYLSLDKDTPYDLRYALVVSNLTYEIVVDEQNQTVANEIRHETSGVICTVDYSVDKGTVTTALNDVSLTDGVQHGNHLNNLTGLMLGEIIYASLYSTEGVLVNDITGQEDTTSSGVERPFFNLLLRSLQGNQQVESLLSADRLQASAVQVFGGIAVQFMRTFYMAPSTVQSTGIVSYTEEKLHIAPASLWIMVAFSLLLVLLAFCVLWTRPVRVVPRNPDHISASATILMASADLQSILERAGSIRTSQLIALLRECTFASKNTAEEPFQIEAIRAETPTSSSGKQKIKTHDWIPLPARWYMALLTFFTPLAVIAVLEVLYQRSQADQGIANVTNSEQTATYLSRYLSALVMLLVATSFNALDFTIASFAPYSMLRSGGMPARRSIRFSILGELPFVALWRSLRYRHFSSALSNIAGMLGSVLTIIASGLWVIDRNIVMEKPVQATLMNSWNVTWHNSSWSGDGGAGVTLDGVQHGSQLMPTPIWNDFVIPSIGDIRLVPGASLHGLPNTESQNFTVASTALRPVLECDIVEDEHVLVEYRGDPETGYLMTVVALPPLQPPCQRGGQNGDKAYYNFTSAVQPPGPDVPTWMGEFFDLHLGPWLTCPKSQCPLETVDYGEGWDNLHLQPDNPAGCPSIGVVFGKTKENATTHDDVTVLICSQKVEQADLRLTYEGRNAISPVLNSRIPPELIDGSSSFVTNGTPGMDSFPYRPQTYISNGGYGSSNLSTFNENGDQQVLDDFINNLVYGPNGTALASLAGKSNRPTFINAVQVLYAKYMSLVIDAKFRQPFPRAKPKDSAERTVHGTVKFATSRLQVDYASKLVLQITLGIMTLLIILAFWLTDLRGTLPRKPTSIASCMGFLAGSELCRVVLPGIVEDSGEREVERMLDGWVLGLGWWGEKKEGSDKRRFGIDVGEPEQLGFRETKWEGLRRRWFVRDTVQSDDGIEH